MPSIEETVQLMQSMLKPHKETIDKWAAQLSSDVNKFLELADKTTSDVKNLNKHIPEVNRQINMIADAADAVHKKLAVVEPTLNNTSLPSPRLT